MFPLYDTVRSRRFPFINWMLVLLNGLVFYYELTMSEAGLYIAQETFRILSER
jgi:hypothetical protein